MPRPPRPVLEAERPLCFAHRGGAALWPENTLFAFRKALELGCDVIETDLRMTRDGELVLFHDETLDRTTNGAGRLEDLDLETLRRLDAGYRFTRDGETYPFRGQGLTIPTLHEALALGPGVRLNVEIKPFDPAVVGRLVDFIELENAHERLIVGSFHGDAIRTFRSATRHRVATSASRAEVARFFAASRVGLTNRLNIEYDALQIPPHTKLFELLDRRLMRAAHHHGVQVHVWTINSPPEMRRLLDLAVDGIMSDRPDRLVPTVAHYAQLDRVSRV